MSRPLRPAPLRGLPVAEQTLPALLERQAAAFPERPALRCGATERTFTEVRDVAAGWAAALAGAGIEPGDRVAAMCDNRIELLDLILGCACLGAVAVPINTAVRGPQLSHALVNSGARALLADGGLVEYLGFIEPPPQLEAVWALDGAPALDGYHVTTPPALDGRRLINPATAGQTAAILYTSGTTGVSKGVCCPHAQFYWWGVLVSEMLGIEASDIVYTCLPLFHTNALNGFVQALLSGATYVIGPRFSASRLWTELEQRGATVTYLLGAMINILLSRPPTPADTAHRVRIALSPATPARLFDAFKERFGVQLVEGFGSTETNCAIASPWLDFHRAGYMGMVRDGFQARVVDEQDAELPDGVPGELVLRGDEPFSMATGYFGLPEQTVEAWRNLWFHTGDRVVREADGWFRFVDRLKDSIRRRGENISSFEVEQALLEHSAISAVAVFPVPSELAEDEVMAVVILEPDATLEPDELVRFCEPRLAYYAIPRFIEVAAELPLTENGKVRKQVLRDRGVTASTWDREAAGVRVRRHGGGTRP